MFDMSDSKEKLYIETDYSCAYCGQKGLDNLSVDHIDGQNARKANSYDNLIVLCHNCHHRKTNGKGITLDQIKKLKKSLIYKTLTLYGVNAIKTCVRNNYGIAATPFLVNHLVELGLLKFTEEISSYGSNGHEVSTEALYQLTDEGKRIYDKWLR